MKKSCYVGIVLGFFQPLFILVIHLFFFILGVQYELAQFHFHWSDKPSGGGSEHTHEGKQYFAEVSIFS